MHDGLREVAEVVQCRGDVVQQRQQHCLFAPLLGLLPTRGAALALLPLRAGRRGAPRAGLEASGKLLSGDAQALREPRQHSLLHLLVAALLGGGGEGVVGVDVAGQVAQGSQLLHEADRAQRGVRVDVVDGHHVGVAQPGQQVSLHLEAAQHALCRQAAAQRPLPHDLDGHVPEAGGCARLPGGQLQRALVDGAVGPDAEQRVADHHGGVVGLLLPHGSEAAGQAGRQRQPAAGVQLQGEGHAGRARQGGCRGRRGGVDRTGAGGGQREALQRSETAEVVHLVGGAAEAAAAVVGRRAGGHRVGVAGRCRGRQLLLLLGLGADLGPGGVA